MIIVGTLLSIIESGKVAIRPISTELRKWLQGMLTSDSGRSNRFCKAEESGGREELRRSLKLWSVER